MSIKAGERNNERPINKPSNEQNPRENAKAAHNRFVLALQRKALTTKLVSPVQTKPMAKKAIPTHKEKTSTSQQTERSDTAIHKELDPQSPFQSVQATNLPVERTREADPSLIAQSTIAAGRADDINQLIKKLTLNFHAKHNEAGFSIANGIFEGAQFSIVTDDHDLRLRVRNASESAERLLVENQPTLKTMLADREINLCDVMFLS